MMASAGHGQVPSFAASRELDGPWRIAAIVLLASAVAAPALVNLGIDALAANLFVLYFAVLSNIHPPVGITAYAAAGIAGAPPMRTGLQAIKIAAPGFVIPFAFAFHPALLFAGSAIEFMLAGALTAISVMGIAAGLAGYLLLPLGMFERLIMTAAACLLVAPSPWVVGVSGFCLAGIWLKQAVLRRRKLGSAAPLSVAAVAVADH